MATLSNEERKKIKREAILESARVVFSRKGLIDVTMKDIIEECGISRGGIYLYFESVDEIFIEALKQRSTRKFDAIRQSVKEGVAFEQLLADFFAGHKDRLLNQIGDGMLRAMYEYYFTHKSKEDHAFQQAQFETTKQTIFEILTLGVKQQVLENRNLEKIAENFLFVIEGLGVLALTGGISEQQIDEQFAMMEELLPRVN
ncbi:MAG: TetR/AcrR family transcriptional regulator [Enterococcus sp.]